MLLYYLKNIITFAGAKNTTFFRAFWHFTDNFWLLLSANEQFIKQPVRFHVLKKEGLRPLGSLPKKILLIMSDSMY